MKWFKILLKIRIRFSQDQLVIRKTLTLEMRLRERDLQTKHTQSLPLRSSVTKHR